MPGWAWWLVWLGWAWTGWLVAILVAVHFERARRRQTAVERRLHAALAAWFLAVDEGTLSVDWPAYREAGRALGLQWCTVCGGCGGCGECDLCESIDREIACQFCDGSGVLYRDELAWLAAGKGARMQHVAP